MLKALLACVFSLSLLACSTAGPPPSSSAGTRASQSPSADDGRIEVVPERYVSQSEADVELDSLATWPTPDGHTWLIVTAKASHELVVFDADSGQLLRKVGGKGALPGEFSRPNGITVQGNHVLVVERDNHRVQVLSLPDFTPEGMFGEKQLRSPYGIWIDDAGADAYEVYVTDNFMLGEHYDVVPPFDELSQRIHRYQLAFTADGRLDKARDLGTFGSKEESTALRIVESLAGDPAQRRLLIADEDARHETTLREYSFDGHATGRALPAGTFKTQAEGVSLWSCTPDIGYWIAVDQSNPLTHFLVFDRKTLAPRGSFKGTTTSNTDGITLHAAAMPSFPSGALFAVHDDKAISAFDLADVVSALGLDPSCSG